MNQKRLPAPGVLRTPISPPIAVDQLSTDRQAEPGAAVLPGRRTVGLREGVEESLGLLGADADAGVAHLSAQHDTASASGLDVV